MNFQTVGEALNGLMQYPEAQASAALVEEIKLAASQLVRGESYYLAIIQKTGLDQCSTVFDAGCGPGHYLNLLGEMGIRTVGMDIRPSNITFARFLNTMCPVRVPPVAMAGDVAKVPYPDGYFDGILCYGVFMFTHAEKTMQEFARLLKPGGRLVMHITSLGFYVDYIFKRGLLDGDTSSLNYGYRLLRNHFLYERGLHRNLPVQRGYTPETIGGLCLRHGFSRPEVGGFGIEYDGYCGEGYGQPDNFMMRCIRQEGAGQAEPNGGPQEGLAGLFAAGQYSELLARAQSQGGQSLAPDAAVLVAKTLHSLDKFQEALSLYQKLPGGQEDAASLELMGDCALNLGNLPLAVFYFDTALALGESLFAEMGKLMARIQSKQTGAARGQALRWLRAIGGDRAREVVKGLETA